MSVSSGAWQPAKYEIVSKLLDLTANVRCLGSGGRPSFNMEEVGMIVKEKRKFNYIILGLLMLVVIGGILVTMNVI